MSSKKGNSRLELFKRDIENSLSLTLEIFDNKTSFSLQFFNNSQAEGSDFKDLTHDQLTKLCDKLKMYCKESLQYWKQQRIGGRSNHVLEIYGEFPNPSGFTKPANIPQDVLWGRFRTEGDFRIPGFILSDQSSRILNLSKNTFYIVFLDPNHKFYL